MQEDLQPNLAGMGELASSAQDLAMERNCTVKETVRKILYLRKVRISWSIKKLIWGKIPLI